MRSDESEKEKLCENIIFGKDLLNFHSFEVPGGKLYPDVQFDIAVDVLNPYTGENGAVHIFSKQKGATDEMKILLEDSMIRLQSFIQETYQINLSCVPGTGAAGGISGILYAILKNVNLKSGAKIVAEAIKVCF